MKIQSEAILAQQGHWGRKCKFVHRFQEQQSLLQRRALVVCFNVRKNIDVLGKCECFWRKRSDGSWEQGIHISPNFWEQEIGGSISKWVRWEFLTGWWKIISSWEGGGGAMKGTRGDIVTSQRDNISWWRLNQVGCTELYRKIHSGVICVLCNISAVSYCF